MTDNKKKEANKKIPEEEAGKKLWKVFNGKESGGQIFSYHNYLLDQSGQVTNPLPRYDKRQEDRTVKKVSSKNQKKDKQVETSVKTLYSKFVANLHLIHKAYGNSSYDPKTKKVFSSQDLKVIDSLDIASDVFYDVSVFIPLLNIYGNPQSIAVYIAKNVTVSEYVSSSKLLQSQKVKLSEDDIRNIIADRVLNTILKSISRKNPSTVFITYRNLISDDYSRVLNENEVDFMFVQNPGKSFFTQNLRNFVGILFSDDGKSENVERDSLTIPPPYFEQDFTNFDGYGIMSIPLYINIQREMIDTQTTRLDIFSLIDLASRSDALKRVTFPNVPKKYKEEINVKVEGVPENQEETEENYTFVDSSLRTRFEDQKNDFVKNGYLEVLTEYEISNINTIQTLIEYSHVLTFKPISTIMNVKSSGSSYSVPKTVIQAIFGKLRRIAGFTQKSEDGHDEDEVQETTAEGTCKPGRGPWFEDLLLGKNTIDIGSLKIDRKSSRSNAPTLNLSGFTKGLESTPKAFSDEPNLNSSEMNDLRVLISQSRDLEELERPENKRLLLRLFKTRASMKINTRTPTEATKIQDRKKVNEERINALTEIMETLGSSFEGLNQSSNSGANSSFNLGRNSRVFDADTRTRRTEVD